MIIKQKFILLSLFFMIVLFGKGDLLYPQEFVGSAQCIGCHRTEYEAWQGSHHDMAMRHAAEDSVKGDFNNAKFTFHNQTSRFFKKGEEYWVHIQGPDGAFQDYQIKYTFGVEPLQQYMVEFEDGRVQLIPFAWDSRTARAGGQRWFHLYPDQTEKHQEFYWTNSGQNWNYMCADCHSTNVNKNFDVKSNTYQTTFSEINVACEACHGPASHHINWRKKPDKQSRVTGFERDLSVSVEEWYLDPGDTTFFPVSIDHSQQTLVCAQCHSRHVQISNKDHVKSKAFGDRYLLNLISSRHYYADGQILDEDYVYGSFLQSKMNENGVVCSNCHDPHSAKLILSEEKVCLQCHLAKAYASQNHHHHKDRSIGAKCVNCHMPETTYMQIDARRDHGWHVPRPDFAKGLGTPDTCLNCHQDKDSSWSHNITQMWYPNSKTKDERPFAPVFAAADHGYRAAENALSHVSQDVSNAPIIRASALERMNRYFGVNTLIAIARGAKNSDENIRLGAIRGAEGIGGAERWRILEPLLKDKILSVRSEAARALMPFWQELNHKQQEMLTPALNDYLEIQNFNSDRGFAHTNMANVFVYQGKYAQAEVAYKNSIRIDPYFVNAYVNLADLYRRQNREEETLKILTTGADIIPDNGSLPYGIGLTYIRNKQSVKAAQYLKKATLIEPDNAQFHYVYGLSIEADTPRQAQVAIAKAYQIGGNPQYLYALCEIKIRHNRKQAKHCIDELRKVAPADAVQNLERKLNNVPLN